ncbi:5-deoxyglucuronate isomerase [Tamaricihabitans halophyticus]|uniref:5-deoxyglucuronate isomerase n=1 Tax=Tamaricihabitans halophyticus TaxID=1262583 RepID=A0A4R2R9W9_9PSEU|nr:5-deoxy-glucuronate isomerase [Tamaricihabitans halophyticus]TCP56481.1 5-deoxyglucuronate isomerase [Tamaricihabitans halophyticus]
MPSPSSLHLPAGSSAVSPYTTYVDPQTAGWTYSSLRVIELAGGQEHEFDTGESEWIVLPLSGSATVRCDAESFELAGRVDVFSGVSDFAYVPRDSRAIVRSEDGGRFALTGARCTRQLPARYGPAADVPVELRGAGQSSRQVNNFGAAGVFEADNLIAVEVLTPAGNWSSFPPHKHDTDCPGEAVLEEIYYFEIAPSAAAPGVGYHRVYPSGPERSTDVLAEVRDRDVVLVPDGWHGPSMAMPGHHMYYLNVMAGPSPQREWLISDDPCYGWIRQTWQDQPVDSRLPLYTAPERRQ